MTLLALVGCGNGEIRWLVEIGAEPWDSALVTIVVEETFLDADPVEVEPESDEITRSTDLSDGLAYLTFEELGDGEAIASFGGALLEGTVEGDVWTFTRIYVDQLVTTTDVGKYFLVETQTLEDDWKMSFTLSNGALEGAVDWKQLQIVDWKESDRWSEENTEHTTALPTAQYLDVDVRNSGDTVDCEGETCRITVTTTTPMPLTLKGVREGRDEGLAQATTSTPIGNPFQ